MRAHGWTLVFFLPAFVLVPACTVNNTEQGEPAPLCGSTLTGSVDAPAWAEARAGIASYRYSVDPATGGPTELTLLDASGATLGTVDVEQLYGDADYRDGTLRAVLKKDGSERVRLFTSGRVLDTRHYQLRARLVRGQVTLDVQAGFRLQSCFESDAAPRCAGTLPLDDGAYTLPSCGLLYDSEVLSGSAPTLERLVYAAPDAPKPPPLDHGGSYQLLEVAGDGQLADPSAVQKWAGQHGVDGLLGSDAERLLTTAFLDRSWWRQVERHVSACLGDSTSTTAQTAQGLCKSSTAAHGTLGTTRQALCNGTAGKPSASDWADSSDAGSSSGFWGDPHMTSLDSTSFDFQAAGEYVLLGADTDPALAIQARFEPIQTQSQLAACADVAVGTALAVSDGKHRIAAYTRPAWHVLLDGSPVSSDHSIALSAGTAFLTARSMRIEFDNGERVQFSGGVTTRLRVHLTTARRGHVHGLLGQFDGNDDNDFVTRDGTLLSASLGSQQLYGAFGDSWRIDASESLFDYDAGNDTTSYTDPAFPSGTATAFDLPAPARDSARKACEKRQITDPAQLEDCILDVACLGDGAADSARGLPAPAAGLPPLLPGAFVQGALGYRAIPSVIDTSPWPSAEGASCQAVASPRAFLQKEQSGLALGQDLSVSAVAPGSYQKQSELAPGTLAAGTIVDSWLITRRPGSLDGPLTGSVRFAHPILGVIVGDGALSSTDATLGSASTTYPGGARSAELGSDTFSIGDDRHTLTLTLDGSDSDELRVVTEAP